MRELTGDPLDRAGRVARIADAVVPSIPRDALAEALEDVCQGDGGELRPEKDEGLAPRFHSARSSCALAVNAFGPWRSTPGALRVFGESGFERMRFERKCPINGVSQRYPPNLDVLLEGQSGVLAIESKLIEYIEPAKPASVESTYDAAIEELADPGWKAAIERLRADPGLYACFGASQIVKHYLGLKSCFPGTRVRLVYLVWEPADHEMHPLFTQHRAEVRAFADDLRDSSIPLELATYTDVFDEWGELADAQVAQHRRCLRDRYELTLFA